MNCGFHLRGYAPLPPALKLLYIDAPQPYTKFYGVLVQTLEARGVKVVTTPADALFKLRIISEIDSKSDGSVSAATNTRQYSLQYGIRYEITTRQGTVVVPPQQIVTSQTLTVNIDAMLASDSEEETMKEEMRLDVSYQLLTRLSSPQVMNALKER